MATTITETLRLPSGVAPSQVEVYYGLAGAGGALIEGFDTINLTTIVAEDSYVEPNGGATTINLTRNDQITPSGTRWRRRIRYQSVDIATDFLLITADATKRVDQVLSAPPAAIAGWALASANNLSDVADPVAALANIGGAVRNRAVNTQTVDYTLVLGDATQHVIANKATAIAVTVPPNSSVAFPVGTEIPITQLGAGLLSIVAGGGVTINGVSGVLASSGQYATMRLVKRATDTWLLMGQTASTVPLGSATAPGIDTQEYWVSKGSRASDSNSGDRNSPFATLAAAITVAEATGLGYTIHLGYGSYNLAGATITQAGARFQGAGEALTSIVGTAANAMFTYNNNTLRVGFDDLTIDGNSIATYGIRPIAGGFIQHWIRNVRITGCVTAGFANVGNSAYTGAWTNVLVYNNGGSGVVLTGQANNVHFFGCAVYYNGADQMILGDGTATLEGIVLSGLDSETLGSNAALIRNVVLNKANVSVTGYYGETPGNVGNRDFYITGTGQSILTINGFYSLSGGGAAAPYPIEIAAGATNSIVEVKGPVVSGYTTQQLVHDSSTSGVITTGPGQLNGALDYGTVGRTAPLVVIGSGGSAPAWTNSFTPLDAQGTGRTPGYRINKGIVYLAGVVAASGTINLSMFTLPAGFRPLFNRTFLIDRGGGAGMITVHSDGTVTPDGVASYQFLDGISYVADA